MPSPDLSWTVKSVAGRVHVHDDIVARALQVAALSQLIELITDPGANPSAHAPNIATAPARRRSSKPQTSWPATTPNAARQS